VLEGHLLAASLEELAVLWLVGDRAHAALGADDGQVSDPLTLSYFKSFKTSLNLLYPFSTHSAKINRRSIFLFGFLTLMLLIFQSGWEVTRAINQGYFPNLWPLNVVSLGDSSLWFNALVQVIFSLNIGAGIMPVVTGKFLYKSDAVK
jgi:solute carrier family 6 (neurotransmitter transporter), invertebrate